MPSKKKPLGNKVINQQDISSINIDIENELVNVDVKVFMEETKAGKTSITNVQHVNKIIKFADLSKVTDLITEIDSLV